MKWMKRWKGCKVCILLAVGWLVLSAVGYMEKDDVYAGYTVDTRRHRILNWYLPGFTTVSTPGVHPRSRRWQARQKRRGRAHSPAALRIRRWRQPGSLAKAETEMRRAQQKNRRNRRNSWRWATIILRTPCLSGIPERWACGITAYGQCLFLCIGGADCVRHVG